MKKSNQDLNVTPLWKRNKTTILYTWNSSSDMFQTNALFERVFGFCPKTFTEVKDLIFKADLTKFEHKITKITNQKNIMMPLRMKAKNQEYSWFVVCFGKVGDDIISGTIDPIDMDIHLQNEEFDRLQNERRRFALEAAEAGLWDWNAKTGEVYYDLKYITMLGYHPDTYEPTIAAWTNRIHPDDYEAAVKAQRHYTESPELGDSFTFRFRFLAADGDYRWIRSQGKILSRDNEGKAVRLVGLHVDITEEERVKIQLEYMASHDLLTGLHNRNYFGKNFSQNDINLLPAAYILVDADQLKMINDCVNHATGDTLLQKLAQTLRFSVRSSDLLARIGGDEFAIFLPHTEEKNARKVLKAIQANIDAANKTSKGMLICASIGIAYANTIEELTTLPIRSDADMLEQKKIRRPESHRRTKEWIESLVSRCCTGYNDKRITPR